MAFKLNFTNSKVESEKLSDFAEQCGDVITKRDAFVLIPDIGKDFTKKLRNEAQVIQFGSNKSMSIKHLPASNAVKYLRETGRQCDSILTAEKGHSDLLPGVYEGGLKIWECSLDLAKYIHEEKPVLQGSAVLELGCGAGIPGIVAYLAGANVTFQDYNEEVLNSVTVANVMLNTGEDDWPKIPERCQFLSGDWSCIQKKYYGQDSRNSPLYDVILTSETIYEVRNHKLLLQLMKHALKSSGVIYLAAKNYYFGVGGSIEDFESLICDDGTFQVCERVNIPEGVGKQILVIKFKDHL